MCDRPPPRIHWMFALSGPLQPDKKRGKKKKKKKKPPH